MFPSLHCKLPFIISRRSFFCCKQSLRILARPSNLAELLLEAPSSRYRFKDSTTWSCSPTGQDFRLLDKITTLTHRVFKIGWVLPVELSDRRRMTVWQVGRRKAVAPSRSARITTIYLASHREHLGQRLTTRSSSKHQRPSGISWNVNVWNVCRIFKSDWYCDLLNEQIISAQKSFYC